MTDITLYDASSIDSLLIPDHLEAKQVGEYFLPLIKGSVSGAIRNVKTKIFLLHIDDILLPITVNEKEYDNAYVTSNYVCINLLKEYVKRLDNPLISLIASPLLHFIGSILKIVKINKIIFVNNWLFSTNLHPELSTSQVERVTRFLTKQFEDHMIVLRSVHNYKGNGLLDALRGSAYRLINCRKVYFYDPWKDHLLDSRAKRHHKSDSKLAEKEQYQVIGEDSLQPTDYARILELYKMVYIDKYTKYSPGFTEVFLQNILKVPNISLRALKKEGKIDGFVVLFKKNNEMIICFLGYDTSMSQSLGLYRMMMDLAIQEARKEKILLNESSGSDTFKALRGMFQKQEYIAVFDRHLPWWRRMLWVCAEFFTQLQSFKYNRFNTVWNKVMKPFTKKGKFAN